MTENTSLQSMNKVMFFMANCGYDDVKRLIYTAFEDDEYLANHIFGKYEEMVSYTRMAFFELYFKIDNSCKKRILEYIDSNYNAGRF